MKFLAAVGHFFMCKYELRSVQSMRLRKYSHFTQEMIGDEDEPVTQALYVCKVCGHPKTETLNGTWSKTDLERITV